jgi:tetratricopeptide (TPR) repeat protein
LDGRTLAELVRIGAPIEVPRLAHEISQALAHVHRIGWVHSDLKPDNIFLLVNDVEGPVRLLDFGYAFDRFADSPDAERGGTARYIAPEIRRGWIADGRADLYSLGMVLRTCFPTLKNEPAWRGILDNLTSPIPADRYPHAIALRDAIAQAFDLEPSMTRYPGFPAGPMRGRDTEIQSIVQTVKSSDPSVVLVQARPGTGLTRFLHEVLLGIAETNMPSARIVDFGNLPSSTLEQAVEFVEQNSTLKATILCGIPDPSPALSWLPERLRGPLNRLRARLEPCSIQLPPLSEESFRELVVTSLGSLDAGGEALVRPLLDDTEGDLREAKLGFDECVRSVGSEEGPSWKLKQGTAGIRAMRAVLATTLHPIPAVPGEFLIPLRRCARAGFAFPAAVAEELLARFGGNSELQGLMDQGYVMSVTPGRLRFVTRRLWREMLSGDDPLASSIDRWLHEGAAPDMDDIESVKQASEVARRVGDRPREAQLLAAGLTAAYDRRRWRDILELVGHATSANGDPATIADAADELAGRLHAAMSVDRARLLLGAGLLAIDPPRAVALLEQVTSGGDSEASAEALLLLIDLVADQTAAAEYQTYHRELTARAKAGAKIPTGILDFFEARHLMSAGDSAGALPYAERAVAGLRGSGSYYEALSLQLLAILQFGSSPEEAVGFLRAAAESASDVELGAQLRHNLALVYGNGGLFHLAEECADSFLRAVGHRLTQTRRVGLRTRRAWAWADLDKIEPAFQEALSLLSLSSVRFAPMRSIPLRLLLAYCHLNRGAGPAAIRESYAAWKDATDTAPHALQTQCLRFGMDVLIDLEAWDFARDHTDDYRGRVHGPDPDSRTTEIRASALLAQAEGRPREALDSLLGYVDVGRGLAERLAAARYLHHLGVAALQAGTDPTADRLGLLAVRTFTEELTVLVTPGHGYYHGRALLGLSSGLWRIGERESAHESLTQAVALARGIGSTGLLTDCLALQARILIDAE